MHTVLGPSVQSTRCLLKPDFWNFSRSRWDEYIFKIMLHFTDFWEGHHNVLFFGLGFGTKIAAELRTERAAGVLNEWRKMDWTQIKLPFPVYQQEPEEKCAEFLKRIQDSLQPSTTNSVMIREDAVFWFLVGCREDVVTKIPFNPAVSNWIEPIELELNLEKIDKGEVLKGPFRACRLQDCFNYYICNRCGHWGHKINMCRNEKYKGPKGSRWKRKLDELKFSEVADQPRNKMRHHKNDEFLNEGNPPWKTMQQQNSSNH